MNPRPPRIQTLLDDVELQEAEDADDMAIVRSRHREGTVLWGRAPKHAVHHSESSTHYNDYE